MDVDVEDILYIGSDICCFYNTVRDGQKSFIIIIIQARREIWRRNVATQCPKEGGNNMDSKSRKIRDFVCEGGVEIMAFFSLSLPRLVWVQDFYRSLIGRREQRLFSTLSCEGMKAKNSFKQWWILGSYNHFCYHYIHFLYCFFSNFDCYTNNITRVQLAFELFEKSSHFFWCFN